MRKFGWGVVLEVIGLTLAAAAVPANAGGYVLSIESRGPDLDPGPQFGVTPGQQFTVAAVLNGDLLGLAQHNSATFDVGFTGPRSLIDNKYLWDSFAYNTGNNAAYEDFSVPLGAADTGILAGKPLITPGLYSAPGFPTRADVHFEALTKAGKTFTSGTLVTLTLTMPSDAQIGEKFLIQPFPIAFVLGFDTVPTDTGSSLGVVVVIPEPATIILVGLGGMAAIRRRFFRNAGSGDDKIKSLQA